MKGLLWMLRTLVGGLFLFSGYVKAVDPAGTAYKLKDYFLTWGQPDSPVKGLLGWTYDALGPFAETLAIITLALELIIGFALILGVWPRLTANISLALILFFTLLTGYTCATGQPSDCGCFGDFLKLTPCVSFLKDLVLLFFILIIWINRSKMKPLFSKRKSVWAFNFLALLSVLFTVRNSMYLPIHDFRDYHIGSNIADKMKTALELGLEPPIYDSKYLVKDKVTGEEIEMWSSEFTENFEKYDFIKQTSKEPILLKEGYRPKIENFIITDANGADQTQGVLQFPKPILLVVTKNLEDSRHKAWRKFAPISSELMSNEILVLGLTQDDLSDAGEFVERMGLRMNFANLDETPLKAMIRSNPGFILLEQGVVKGKWSSYSVPNLEAVKAKLK